MDPAIIRKGYGFAIYPNVKVKGDKLDKKTKKKSFGFLKELLFGDYIKPYLDSNNNPVERVVGRTTYIKVRARRQDGYIKPNEIQANRILEVNFVDVAQGDGCHLVTPDDKHYIIDAGKGDNMYRFLKWRFNLGNPKNRPPNFTGIISHSDNDHYLGFGPLFRKKRADKELFSFDTIYHNGIVEGSGKLTSLGTIVKSGKKNYVTDLVDTNAQYKSRAKKVKKAGTYINMLNKTSAPIKSLRYGAKPIYKKGNMKIEVLGPVTKKVKGKESLQVFDNNKGKTKNGHSIILKLTIGKLRVLLGGDLNSYSEKYLYNHFSKIDVEEHAVIIDNPKSSKTAVKKAKAKIDEAIGKMRKIFEVDIAKSCHHGSPDFTTEFLSALNPIATVISSGDNESHSHPRPDTLGTLGKYSRGKRSLIFSTELARSAKEFLNISTLSATKKKERVVTVYGMINVRTDGEKVIIAQKLEKKGSSKNWDIHKLQWNKATSEFEYVID